MNKEIKDLILYLKNTKNSSHKKILKLAKEISFSDTNSSESDRDLDKETIMVDLLSLQSILDPNVKLESQEVGFIAIEK